MIRKRILAPVVAAVAAALLVVPTSPAAASPSKCSERGGAKMCQRPGHTSLHTSPTVRTPSGGLFGSAWLPGYGRGQLPPLLALD